MPTILYINHLWMTAKYLNKVFLYIIILCILYVCVCVLGFLTTLLLSLPQLASLQRTTASVGTQVEVPAVEESTGRKHIILTHLMYMNICV